MRNNVDVQSIAVPESLGLGYDITALVIAEYTSAEINLNEKIQYISWTIYGVAPIITSNYSGTLEEFTNNVRIDTEYNTCNVEVKDCYGEVKRFKGSDLFFVNVDVFGTEQEYAVGLYGGSNTRLLDATDNDCAYFLIDEKGLAYEVRIEYNDITGNRELVARFRASGNYTLVKHTATLLNADNGEYGDGEMPEEPKYPDEQAAREEFLNRKAQYLTQQAGADGKKRQAHEKRINELSSLILSVYEDKVMKRIPEAICVELLSKYQAEKQTLEEELARIADGAKEADKAVTDVDEFIRRVKQYASLTELDRVAAGTDRVHNRRARAQRQGYSARDPRLLQTVRQPQKQIYHTHFP